jgi:hypothetical protein
LTANAGTDQTICGAVTVSLNANNAANGSWAGGTGTFNPNRNTANAIYTPAAEIGTTITLTWNVPDPDGAGPCTATSDAMNITVNSPSVANAGADQNICGTNNVTLAANFVTGGNWTGGAEHLSQTEILLMPYTLLLPEKQALQLYSHGTFPIPIMQDHALHLQML